MRTLVFGGRGWIASYLIPQLRLQGLDILIAPSDIRLDETDKVTAFLDEVQPHRVVCLVGRTHGEGYSTIDYLELPGKLQENIRDNLFAPLSLAILCEKRGIHMTYLGTGCIFSNNEPESRVYHENDLPDFFGSSYSTVKGFTDRLMHLLDEHVLNVRIRMPIVADMHPRNFITKISKYAKICSMPNSMTVLETLLPYLADMIVKGTKGTINLTNPGYITHNEILKLYKQHIDPSFTWENFSIDEQDAILLSKRSNNVLDTTRLQSMYPMVPNIETAVTDSLQHMKRMIQ